MNTHYLSLRILFTGLHCQWLHFLFMNRQSATTPSVLTPKRKQIDIISTCRMQKLKLHHRSAYPINKYPIHVDRKKDCVLGSPLHHCTCVLGSSSGALNPPVQGRQTHPPHPLRLSRTCFAHACRCKPSRSHRRNRIPAELVASAGPVFL